MDLLGRRRLDLCRLILGGGGGDAGQGEGPGQVLQEGTESVTSAIIRCLVRPRWCDMGGSVQEMCLRARLARVAPPSVFVDISQMGVLLIDNSSVVTSPDPVVENSTCYTGSVGK